MPHMASRSECCQWLPSRSFAGKAGARLLRVGHHHSMCIVSLRLTFVAIRNEVRGCSLASLFERPKLGKPFRADQIGYRVGHLLRAPVASSNSTISALILWLTISRITSVDLSSITIVITCCNVPRTASRASKFQSRSAATLTIHRAKRAPG